MRVAIVGVAAFVAITLFLGAWANGFEPSLDKAVEASAAAAEAVKPEEFELEGEVELETEVIGVFADDAGTIAVVAEVTNPAKNPVVDSPIAIELLDAAGAVVGSNTGPGTDPLLNSIAAIPAGATIVYVNDTSTATAPVETATAEAKGTAKDVKLVEPAVEGGSLEEGVFGVSVVGAVQNPTDAPLEGVRLQAVVRRGDEVVGAGGGLVDQLPPDASAEFQIFIIGETEGELEVWAPPLPR